jgi:multidrug transporter EmrE-like cation transporter
MAWIYLIIAGLFECGWAIGLKQEVARDEGRVKEMK